jgi:serine/threonine protein kinase
MNIRRMELKGERTRIDVLEDISDTTIPVRRPDGRPQGVGRYELFGPIGSGGMGTVHLGRFLGSLGFSRMVAIKRVHEGFAKEPELLGMFRDEIRVAARVRHPNVVATLDVVHDGGDLLLVMEYVHGESLEKLIRLTRQTGASIPPRIASTIACGILHGLHAAHEARSTTNEPLEIIHRDVSPANVLVAADGLARLLDFGIAKSVGRQQHTRAGHIKGKVPYLAPEVMKGRQADRRTDIYGASVVLWEMLAGARLFNGENDAAILAKIVSGDPPNLRSLAPEVTEQLEVIVLRGLDREPDNRFATARDMALALQHDVGTVPPSELGDWLLGIAGESLSQRAQRLANVERLSANHFEGSPRFGAVHTPRPASLGMALGTPSVRPLSPIQGSRISRCRLPGFVSPRRRKVVGAVAGAGVALALWVATSFGWTGPTSSKRAGAGDVGTASSSSTQAPPNQAPAVDPTPVVVSRPIPAAPLVAVAPTEPIAAAQAKAKRSVPPVVKTKRSPKLPSVPIDDGF